jgi:hypothetical protein
MLGALWPAGLPVASAMCKHKGARLPGRARLQAPHYRLAAEHVP